VVQHPAALIEGARAIGRVPPGDRWIGFALRGDTCHFVTAVDDDVRYAAAEPDLLLALAIAHFAEVFEEPPPDIEATQADLSALVRYLMREEADPGRRALLSEALDAIDDGLAGDAVANRLVAARSPRTSRIDPAELLQSRANELATGP
jgi:hypothetical protein